MFSELLKWGRRRADAGQGAANAPPRRAEPVLPSKGLQKFVAALSSREAPVLLDFGPVIGSNVAFCGERLGCRVVIEDLLADIDRHLRGQISDVGAFFGTRFPHENASVDGILCWDVFDFLDKRGAHALARQIVRLLRPGGAVLGFFSTTTVERAPFTKFEIVDEQTLRHRYHQGIGGRKQSLLNRDIIKMFDGLVVSDSLLLKTQTREILLRSPAGRDAP